MSISVKSLLDRNSFGPLAIRKRYAAPINI